MNWYLVRHKDKGAGRNKQGYYMQAEDEQEVRERAPERSHNDMEEKPFKIEQIDPDDIHRKVGMASGYNVAYKANGEKLTKSDVDL